MSVKNFFVACIVLIFTGCAHPGPMQTSTGPMNTPAFEPIVLHKVHDGSKNVLFKEWTTMYKNKELVWWGVFFITDKGVYLATWNTQSYEYNLVYQLPASKIESISNQKITRKIWADSDLLIIKDKQSNEVGFALKSKSSARTILLSKSNKNITN